MPKKECKLCLSIPERDIKKELGWFYERWGEDAVKTYLVKNPQMIDKDLILVGVGELWHPPPNSGMRSRRSDLIFRKDDIYYVVEVKTRRRYAWKQLFEEVACFERDMKEHNQHCEEIVPVLVIIDDTTEKVKPIWSKIEE